MRGPPVGAAASLVLGVLTHLAQRSLPDAWRSFANSASGWTLLTALLVLGSRASTRLAAALGALSFLLLVLGYTAAARIDGLSDDPVYWMTIGAVGVIRLIGVLSLRLRGWAPIAVAVLGSALAAGLFVTAYTALGGGG